MAFFYNHQPIVIKEDEIVYDEKEELQELTRPHPKLEVPSPPLPQAPVELVREYCPICITADGEIKCPRRHRCKSCHCYLTDDEWFLQHNKK